MGDAKRTVTCCRSKMHLSIPETIANNPLPFLPEELIVKILLKLPVKFLLQFKCVCKLWKTLISDTQFANNHLLSSTAYPRLVTSVTTSGSWEIKSYPIESLLQNSSTTVIPVTISTGHQQYKILGSCNGFLCLSDVRHTYVRLWNPYINFKSKKSPTFDDCIYCYGFGYDHVNDKYKFLAQVVIHDGDCETKTIIYTFDDNILKTIEDFPGNPYTSLGKFMSGTLNWMVEEIDLDVIVSFDIVKETYRQVLLPRHDGYDVCDLYILSNCLSVCFNNSEECCWALWMMKEYGVVESWTKLMTIPHEKLLILNRMRCYVVPLFISENGVVLLVNMSSSKFILYNLNSGELNYPRILGKVRKVKSDLHIYHESLLSPQW